MPTEIIILLITCYTVSSVIVYSRSYGLSKSIRRIITWVPVIGIIYYAFKGKHLIDSSFIYGILSGPIVTGILYELFDYIGWKVNKRSFHLHARGAKDMKGLGLPWDNNHYKWIDIFFSLILISIWIGWPFIFVVTIHVIDK